MNTKDTKVGILAALIIVPALALGLGMAGCKTGDGASEEPAGSGEVSGCDEYVCPMHPEVRQSEPGTCPDCGMDLVCEAGDEPSP